MGVAYKDKWEGECPKRVMGDARYLSIVWGVDFQDGRMRIVMEVEAVE